MNIMTIPKVGDRKKINKTINCNLHKNSKCILQHLKPRTVILEFITKIFFFFSEFYKPRRRPRTYYQRRRERIRKQEERERERQELEAMQIQHDLSDSDSSDEDFDCFEDEEIEENLEQEVDLEDFD